MKISDRQIEDLSKLFNIAAGRAVSAIAELAGNRVHLEVPKVEVLAVSTLAAALDQFIEGDIVVVYQIFDGAVAGTGMMMLDYEGAVLLTNVVSGETNGYRRLDQSAMEVLTEIGNILLNAMMSTFGDILQKRVTFSVPRIHLDDLDSLMQSLQIDDQEPQDALLAYTRFQVHTAQFSGYLVVLMGVTSLQRLLHALEFFGDYRAGLVK